MTTPVYNAKVPQPENSIDQGQTDFLNNFSTLFTAFSQDHVPLDSVSNAGNHAFTKLIEGITGAATGANEIALYSKDVVEQTDQLYYRPLGNGTEIQFSNYQVYPLKRIKNGNADVQVPYFTFLPGNVIMYFGEINLSKNPMPLILEPAICTDILNVSLGVLNEAGKFPSGSLPIPNDSGKYGRIDLFFGDLVGTNQNYIIYGKI